MFGLTRFGEETGAGRDDRLEEEFTSRTDLPKCKRTELNICGLVWVLRQSVKVSGTG
jgi:hypothetical protein